MPVANVIPKRPDKAVCGYSGTHVKIAGDVLLVIVLKEIVSKGWQINN
jgi:hypothetical protein